MAFKTRYGHCELTVMSFEHANAYVASTVFIRYLDKFVEVLIDDILVYS